MKATSVSAQRNRTPPGGGRGGGRESAGQVPPHLHDWLEFQLFMREVQTIPGLLMKIDGAVEAEGLKILAKSGDFPAKPQFMGKLPGGQWSGNRQLLIVAGKVGDWIDLELPVAAGGNYRIIVHATKAPDFGIVRVHINGNPVGPQIDCFNDKVVSAGPFELGTTVLKKGRNTLRVEVVGTNPKSKGSRFLCGLDCFVLRPVITNP
jgi:hypothetical protein